MALRLLLVEDSEDDALLVVRELRKAGHEVDYARVQTREGMEAAVRDGRWDIVITDNSMPQFSADEAIRLLGEADMDLPVLVVSGTMTEEHAVSAMRAGARDFIVKGNLHRLPAIVERELRESEGRWARAQSEAALRKTAQRQGLILGHLPIVLYSATPNAILWVSDNSRDVTGFPPMAFLGKGHLLRQRIHDEDRERVVAGLRGLGAERAVSCEYRWQRADGEWRWFLDHAALPEGAQGNAGEFHGMLLDVSDRKKLEGEFRQSQKLEALGLLAAGVAHDFNNMLTAIQGYGELLKGDLPAGGRQAGFAEEITKASARAAALTRQLLAFSRRQLLQPKILRINDVIAESVGMLQRLVTSGVRVTTRLDPALHSVLVDPSGVDQIMLNLAVNARDAMNGSGELRIETANVAPEDPRRPLHAAAGPWVMISFTDTGIGMDEALIAKIFEPFFTTKGPGHGTGLGLATVKGIVERSGGHIAVESRQGVGTTFRILLPPAGPVSSAPGPSAPAASAGGTERILIVDDDPVVAGVMAMMLGSLGYATVRASSGEEAVRLLQDPGQVIHLVVTDMVMPDMDGLALAEGVEGVRPGMRIMYVSGHQLGHGYSGGPLPPDVVFLPKPFSRETLAAKVRAAMERPR